MNIPTYDQCMLPLLQLAGDRQEHRVKDAIDYLAQHFGLTEEELEDLLPSGRDTTFSNRVRWASTYLRKANLLESTGRGVFKITKQGLIILKNPPKAIDKHFLMQFKTFAEFQERPTQSSENNSVETDSENTSTPLELLHSSYQNIKKQLAQELLDQILSCSDKFFEILVVNLLLAMGYGTPFKGASQIVGGSGDGGIDGIIHQDKLGFDVIYVQAKRWKPDSTIGRLDVQGFAGSLLGQGLGKGVMISTCRFSQEAQRYAATLQNQKIILIDGQQLAELMIEHNIGVTAVETYIIKKIDTDYFDLEG